MSLQWAPKGKANYNYNYNELHPHLRFCGEFFYIKLFIPSILALVLGRLAENSLRQVLTISGGSLSIFFTRPISALFIAAAILAYLTPVIRWARKGVTTNPVSEKMIRKKIAYVQIP